MTDHGPVTDYLLEQARLDGHLTALLALLLQKGVIIGAEYEAALHKVVAARLLADEDAPVGGTNPSEST